MKRKNSPPPARTETGRAGSATRLPPGRVFLLALGFSVWTGLAEEVPVFVAPLGGVVIRLSRDFYWMTPLGDFLFFTVVAVALLALSWSRPGAATRPAVLGVFSGLTALALGLVPERIHPLAVLILAIGVGVQVRRLARPAPRSSLTLPVLTAVGLLLVGGLTVRKEWTEWNRERQWVATRAPAPGDAPNILLLILDTVRGSSLDFLGALGGASRWDPVEAPSLEALAKEAVVFERAMAPSPWTLPSHASMFTGRWPITHQGGRGLSVGWMGALGPEYPTVAEVLRRQGYFTAGFVGNLVFTSAETGLARGFITYEDYTVTLGQVLLSCSLGRRFARNRLWRRALDHHDTLNRKKAGVVADQFLDWQAHHEGGPYFAFLNFFDAHEPYFPPDSIKDTMPPGSRWDDISHFVGLLTGATAWRTDKWEMDSAEQRAHAAGYGEGIRQADRELGRVLDELGKRGGLENTVVIVASDHGEQLGEHRLYNHNNSLYLPLLHVPLLVRDIREEASGRRVSEVVSLRDLGATILDLAGIEPGSRGIPGRSLSRFWREPAQLSPGPRASLSPDTIFATLNRGVVDRPWYPVGLGPTMYSLTDSLHHYILNGDGTEELYSLLDDAPELDNLAGKEGFQGILEDFRATLRSLVGDFPVFPSDPALH
ncbi:MAG: sulfatase-like hydrolase/transferase [Longimicrobiales bacterium]